MDELKQVHAALNVGANVLVETTFTAENYLWGSGDPVNETCPSNTIDVQSSKITISQGVGDATCVLSVGMGFTSVPFVCELGINLFYTVLQVSTG